jgi:hypothetical protein
MSIKGSWVPKKLIRPALSNVSYVMNNLTFVSFKKVPFYMEHGKHVQFLKKLL